VKLMFATPAATRKNRGLRRHTADSSAGALSARDTDAFAQLRDNGNLDKCLGMALVEARLQC
jgi:hypothetical protein